MINVEVLLVVTASIPRHPSEMYFLLLRDNGEHSLPRAPIGNLDTTLSVAAYLLQRYTGLEAIVHGVGWVQLMPGVLRDDPNRVENGCRSIGIPYFCFLPSLVDLKHNAEWVDLYELAKINLYGDHIKIINRSGYV